MITTGLRFLWYTRETKAYDGGAPMVKEVSREIALRVQSVSLT